MRFPSLVLPTSRPIPSLTQATVRHRPSVPVRISGPTGSWLMDCSLDCGTDDTIFPRWLADKLGVDLTNAEAGEARPMGTSSVPYCYAKVALRLTDGQEVCEWEAVVGFVTVPLRWPILGHAGFLQFFDVELLGQRQEVKIRPNPSFPGWRGRR